MEVATVLGASSGIGKAVVDGLLKRDVEIKILVPNVDTFKSFYPEPIQGEIEVIEGDLDNNRAFAAACEYSDTIFPCFNTFHDNWNDKMVDWNDKVSNIGAAMNARIIYPGNTLVFGSINSTDNPISEEYPKDPHTQRGQLQVAFEYRLARAANEGASLTILRFPNLYGSAVLDNIMYPIFNSALENETCRWYGDAHKKTNFLFSSDAGEAMVMAALSHKATDTELNVPGPKPVEPDSWLNKIYEFANASTRQNYKIPPKWQLYLASIIKKEMREFLNLYYLFEDPILLDGKKFERIVGQLPTTNHDNAIKSSIKWYDYWNKN